MAHLDDDNPTAGTGDLNGTPEPPNSAGLEQRVKALEQENAKLRAELAELRVRADRDRLLLDTLLVQGLPMNQQEMDELLATSKSISDVLRDSERHEGAAK